MSSQGCYFVLGVVTSDLHLKLDELTADATGASEDFSKASDGETKRSGPTQSVKSSKHVCLTHLETR